MLLVLHVGIALVSVGYSAYLLFSPSKSALRTSSMLIGSTLVTGTALVLSTQANLVRACIMGLIFTGFSLFSLIVARQKLAQATTDIK